MIRAGDRVAKVLAQDERLLDVFVAASPAFEKLRHGALRRTMARLVTVEQAARIAGLDADVLVTRLNQVLAGEPPRPAPGARDPAAAAAHAPAAAAVPDALRALPPERIVDLDVRDDLRTGKEPFRQILDAARALAPDRVLRLRALFEPAPLYAVLARMGLAHATEQLGPDDWRVWFHRAGTTPSAAATAAPAGQPGDTGDDVLVLDVRGLEPPEPMVRTLAALATLPRGKTLVQINVRVPQYLLPKLAARGFTYEIREQGEDLVRIFIHHTRPQETQK